MRRPIFDIITHNHLQLHTNTHRLSTLVAITGVQERDLRGADAVDDPRLRNGGRPGRKEILCEVHLALNIILVYTSHFEKIKNMHITETCTNIPAQFRNGWLKC